MKIFGIKLTKPSGLDLCFPVLAPLVLVVAAINFNVSSLFSPAQIAGIAAAMFAGGVLNVSGLQPLESIRHFVFFLSVVLFSAFSGLLAWVWGSILIN